MAAGRVFYFPLGQGGRSVLPFNEPFHNKGSVFYNLIELRRVCSAQGEKGGVSFPQQLSSFPHSFHFFQECERRLPSALHTEVKERLTRLAHDSKLSAQVSVTLVCVCNGRTRLYKEQPETRLIYY